MNIHTNTADGYIVAYSSNFLLNIFLPKFTIQKYKRKPPSVRIKFTQHNAVHGDVAENEV